jgi:ADP-ribosyl-[dinitrogen reductase] hydrolase
MLFKFVHPTKLLILNTVSMQNAFLGSLVGDAIAMPAHWYYDRNALDRDYGDFDSYLSPRNPHPDSILWRSKYEPIGPKADILHDQAKFWGERGVHYHQFLQAGENTLNLKLSVELYRWIILRGSFDLDEWLARYAEVMLTPGWHHDTYAEEYHRNFFANYARGKSLRSCGSADLHIGALSLIPGLLAGLEALEITDPATLIELAVALVRATHDHEHSLRAAADFTRILLHVADGVPIRKVLSELPIPGVSVSKFMNWVDLPDRTVVGEKLSTACYLPESFVASLYFAWKYHDDFSLALLQNAKVGGDNCHRAVVVGASLGIGCGVPRKWLRDLVSMEDLRCDLRTVKNLSL